MRRFLYVVTVLLCSCPLFSLLAAAQQPSTPQGWPFLKRSFALLTGGTRIKDLTLLGTATLFSGSTSESGPVKLIAVGVSRSEFVATLPSGTRTEVRTIANGVPAESSAGPSGVFSIFGAPDAGAVPDWFFPAKAIAPGLSLTGNYSATYIGRETRHGVLVDHVRMTEAVSAASALPLGFHDIYITPTHYLVALVFTLPNSASPLGIPVEIDYSNYQSIQGLEIPYHIQVYRESGPLWDIQLSSYSINTGATVAATARSAN